MYFRVPDFLASSYADFHKYKDLEIGYEQFRYYGYMEKLQVKE